MMGNKRNGEDFRSLFNENPLAMWIFDPTSRAILEVNKSAQIHYGFTRAEFLSMTIEDLRFPEDCAALRVALESFNKDGAIPVRKPVLWRHRRKNGSKVFAEVMWSRVTFQNQPSILATVLSMTESLPTRALGQSREYFGAIIEAVNDAFWDWDLSTGSLWWSAGIRAVFQYTEDQVQPSINWWRQRIHPEDMERVVAKLQEHLNSDNTQWEDEYRYLRADGNYATVLDRGYIIRNADGKPERMVGTLLDITRRKQAEEQAQLYSDIFKNTQIGLYVHHMEDLGDDSSFRVVAANPASEKITGLPAREIIGRSLDSCFPQLRERGIIQQYAEVVRTGRAFEFEDIMYGDNAIATGHYSARFFPLPNQCIGIAFEDITGRLRSEERLRLVEKKFETLAAMLPVGIYQTDAEGKCTYVNEKCAELCGVPGEKLLGRNWVKCLHPEDRRRIQAMWQNSVRRRSQFGAEYRFQRPDGTTVWVLTQAVPEYHENGQFVGFIGSITDINDRKRLENEIIEISAQEEQRIGQALHDRLGQHLTGIAFLAKALAGRLTALEMTESQQAEDIAGLINQAILRTRDLARMLHPVELEENGLLGAFQDLALNASRMFEITCQFQFDPAAIVQDNVRATHLYHIAQEAITNAVKHGHASIVRMELGVDNGHSYLRIEDNGLGLPPAVTHPNTGIGLRIMKYRAAMIDGELRILPSPNGGTVVECIFSSPEPALIEKKQ